MKEAILFKSAFLFSAAIAQNAIAQEKPNILIIITDQQRNDDMSCAGNPWVKTPSIDAIAERGVRFTNSYCVSPLSVPSRASLATSRMPYEVMTQEEVKFKHIPDGMTSTGLLFREAGYRTAWSGKWHVRSVYPKKENDGGDLPGFEVLDNKLLPAEALGVPELKLPPKEVSKEYNFDSGIADAAVEFLNQIHTKPFLLTISLLDPHGVCGNNEEKLEKHALTINGTLPPVPNNLNAPNETITSEEGAHPPKGRKENWKDISFQRYIHEYYLFTEKSDQLIGKVMEALQRNGFEKSTIVIFTSDHGEMLGAHHIVMKTVPYEEAITVPFIMAGPGIPTHVVDSTHFVSGLDMLPTICGFAGIKIPSETRGLNINNIIKNQNGSWREAVFAAVDGNNARVARTERYKYIRLNRATDNELLYDMQNDKLETKNLASDAKYADVLNHHRILLKDWMKKTNDPFLKALKQI